VSSRIRNNQNKKCDWRDSTAKVTQCHVEP